MKTIQLLLFAPLLISFLSCDKQSNQEKQTKSIESTGVVEGSDNSKDNQFGKFIPEGYIVLDSVSGDLNRDKFSDMLLLLQEENEAEKSEISDEPVPRPLLILLGGSVGEYTLGGRNDRTVYCYTCGGMMGDPYVGLTIKNGYFSVEHMGGSSWRWTKIVTYKFSQEDNDWLLHRDGGESFHSGSPEESSEKYMKTKKDFGQVNFEDYDIYQNQ